MKSQAWQARLGAAVLACAAGAIQAAPKAVSFEEALPADTVFYARVRIGPSCRATEFLKFWNEPATSSLRDKLVRQGRIALFLAALPGLEGNLSVAVMEPLIFHLRNPQADGPAFSRGLILFVMEDVPPDSPFSKKFEAWVSKNALPDPLRREGEFRLQRVKLSSVMTDRFPLPFVVARSPGRIVVGFEEDVLSLLRRLAGKPGAGLAGVQSFARARQAVQAVPETKETKMEGVFAFARLALFGRAAAFPEWGDAALAIAPDGPAWRTRICYRGGLSGSQGALSSGHEALKYIPATASLCAMSAVDLSQVARWVAAWLSMSADPRWKSSLATWGAARDFLDVVLRVPTGRWLSAVGPQAVFYVGGSFLPPSGCLILEKGESFAEIEPGLLAFARLAEAVEMDRSTKSGNPLGAGAPSRIQEIPYRGRTIRCWAGSPFQISYVVDGRWILVGPMVELKAALSRAEKGTGEGTLGMSGRYMKAFSARPVPAVARVYADLLPAAPFLSLFGGKSRTGVGNSPFLPDPEALAALLAEPVAIDLVHSEGGWTYEERAPAPLLAVALATAVSRAYVLTNVDSTGKVIVGKVEAGSNAAAAGLSPGDVIVKYGQEEVTAFTLREAIGRSRPGTLVELEIERAGERRVLQVRGGESLGIGVAVGIDLEK